MAFERDGQCIHCSVRSCRHHAGHEDMCALESIHVSPTKMADSGDPADESMCDSYHRK